LKTIPIEEQVVKIDWLQSVEWMLEAVERVSNQYLARAVEGSTGRPLPPKLLRQVVLVLKATPDKHRRGPKGMSPAKLDHRMTIVDERYSDCAIATAKRTESFVLKRHDGLQLDLGQSGGRHDRWGRAVPGSAEIVKPAAARAGPHSS
jgi:hypothetical protein